MHHADGIGSTLELEELQPRHANAVLAGNRAAKVDRRAVELLAGGRDTSLGFGIAALPPEGRMQVSVPGVAERPAVQAAFRYDALDGIEELHELGPRRADVLHARGTQPLDCAQREPARLAQPIGLQGVRGAHLFDRPGSLGGSGRGIQLSLCGGAGEVRFDQEQGGGIGQVEVEGVVDRTDGHAVHQLQRAGHQARCGDALDGVARAIGLGKEGQQRCLGWRSRAEPQHCFRYEAERALRAHE